MGRSVGASPHFAPHLIWSRSTGGVRGGVPGVGDCEGQGEDEQNGGADGAAMDCGSQTSDVTQHHTNSQTKKVCNKDK